MNPFEPNDPLWKLLGQGREVEARPNFAQNVARAARHTPQERGWRARWLAWWRDIGAPLPARGLVVAAAVALAAGWGALVLLREGPAVPSVAQQTQPKPAEVKVVEAPLVPEVETQLESLDYLDALLALEDTSGLTDKEVAYLLY